MSDKKRTENETPDSKALADNPAKKRGVPQKKEIKKAPGGRAQGPKVPAGAAPGLSPIVVASIWMSLGAYVLTTFLPIALAMVGYGFSFLFSSNERGTTRSSKGGKVSAAANGKNAKVEPLQAGGQSRVQAVVPFIGMLLGYVVGAMFPPAPKISLLLGFLGAILALVVAGLVVTRRASITTAYIVAALSTLVMIAIEAAAAWMHGQTLMETVQASVMDAIATLKPNLPLDMQGEVTTFVPLAQLLWPFSLFCMVGLSVALTHAAARIAQLNVLAREQAQQIKVWSFSNFDAPFWTSVVLAVGAALFFFGPALWSFSATAAFWIQAAGLGAMAATRFIFLFDGAGVLSWFFTKNRWGCVIRALLFVLALYFEVLFFVVSILGLVDFWVNFRKLPRNKRAKSGSSGPGRGRG